jgi:hypothetical protein
MDEGLLDGVSMMSKFCNFIASEPDIAKVSDKRLFEGKDSKQVFHRCHYA